MNDFFRRYLDLIILVFLLFMAFALLLDHLRGKATVSPVERVLISVLAPFQNAAGYSYVRVTDLVDDYLLVVNKSQENKELREETAKLRSKINLLKEELYYYARLRKQFAYKNPFNIPFVPVRVIGRDPVGRAHIITIDKGSNNGLERNMPLVTHNGLVGRIITVAPNASKVLLITDSRSAVDSMLQKSRFRLVAGGVNGQKLETKYLSIDADPVKDETVISSGLGGIFPKGLIVGYITDRNKKPTGLFTSAFIKPGADLEKLEEALVLLTGSDR